MERRLDPGIPALVTGASSGIGEVFARRLAARGHNVTVVARRLDRLERLAEELHSEHHVRVTPLAADLETEEGREVVAARLRRNGAAWILVNNAGFGTSGRFVRSNLAREAAEVNVNVVAVHRLTGAVLPGCLAHRAGGVINVASTAAYQPLPYMATYAATKAFVLHFTEALAVEMRGSGVRVMALCPGPVRTAFAEVSGVDGRMDLLFPMSPERCVDVALGAFDRNRTICVPGPANALLAETAQLAPRALVRRLAGTVLGR